MIHEKAFFISQHADFVHNFRKPDHLRPGSPRPRGVQSCKDEVSTRAAAPSLATIIDV
jgi:hypothetical protein